MKSPSRCSAHHFLISSVQQLSSRLLSAESAKAVKTVRTIITSFDDHGVENVFKQYPAKDVIFSILALGKLQRAEG
jgi:hypothetical protein